MYKRFAAVALPPGGVLTKCVDDFYPAADMAVEGIQFLRRHPQFPVTGSADGVDFKLPGIGVVEFKARDISSMIVVAGGVPARGDLDGVLLLKDGIEDRLPRQTRRVGGIAACAYGFCFDFAL